MPGLLAVGPALIIMLKLCGAPSQPRAEGVATMLAVPGVAAAGKLILPLPLAARPIAGLLFVQVTSALLLALKFTATGASGQTVWSFTGDKIGRGLTVMANFSVVPTQVPCTGVTIMLAVCGALLVMAVKLSAALPIAPRPMAVLSFIQLNVAPAEPAKARLTGVPEQTVRSDCRLTVGTGVTVMLKFCGEPKQVPAKGVATKLAVVALVTLAALKLMLPVPFVCAKPIPVLLFVQIKFAPAEPEKLTATAAPAQTV